MSTEATIKINLEEGNASKTLKDLKKDVDAVDSSVDNLNKDFKEGQQESAKSTISLKTQLKNLKDEMVQLDHNSPEFKQMALEAGAMEDKIKDVDAQVRILSSDTKGLDALVGAGQAIGGAFQASQGAMALFGQENEKVQKAIQNVIAVQGIMNGVMAVSNAIRKESVVGQKLLVVWNGIVTAAQWLWNVAVSANPIGLIVIGVAALIAGIVLLVMNIDKVIKFFKNWTNVLFLMLGPLGWLILAYRALKEETDELEDARQKQSKAENSRHKQQLRDIDKLRKKEAEAHKDKLTAIDLEIDRLEAEGKSSFALKLQRLKDIRMRS
jgi:seryl-tRNA synthetase